METQRHFYPRSPCGERRSSYTFRTPRRSISIHALLAESDRKRCQSRPDSRNFYPRSPCGERQLTPITAPAKRHFYPRSPCGERPAAWAWDWYAGPISIHALLAESDTQPFWFCIIRNISIHALLAESDGKPGRSSQVRNISIHALLAESDRPPGRRACGHRISIHALLAESDQWFINGKGRLAYFYPRSPCGERPDV